MSQAVLSWDLRELETIQTALNKAGGRSFKPMMESLALEIEEQTRARFETKEGPDGPWDNWSEKYAEKKAGSGQSLLRQDNYLEESITHNFSGSNGVNAQVAIGSPMIYAANHQYGDDDRGIPARAYLGITAEDEDDLVLIINDYINGLFE